MLEILVTTSSFLNQHYNKGAEMLVRDLEAAKDDAEACKDLKSRLATAYVSMCEIFMTVMT